MVGAGPRTGQNLRRLLNISQTDLDAAAATALGLFRSTGWQPKAELICPPTVRQSNCPQSQIDPHDRDKPSQFRLAITLPTDVLIMTRRQEAGAPCNESH